MLRVEYDSVVLDNGWPSVRLRTAFALLLFFVFETLIGRQLPTIMPGIALGLGSVFFVSAMAAIGQWKLAVQLAAAKDALDRRL